jgi:hypothetical protein
MNPNCGVQQFMLVHGSPPDLLIVLDKSGSMNEYGGGGSKWDQVRAALAQTVTSLQNQIRWGLQFFPADDTCGTQGPAVDIGPGNASAITNAMGLTSPDGATPTAEALRTAGNYLSSLPDGDPKYILLATDGAPNCGGSGGPMVCTSCPPGYLLTNGQCCTNGLCSTCAGDDVAGSLQMLQVLRGAGVPTFVIGISLNGDEQDALNQMAMAGGQPRAAGPPYFYPASSTGDLVSAINQIAGQIVSCSYPLSSPPVNPSLVTVSVAMRAVPRDPGHGNGWDFGPGNGSIQFYGEWCGVLQQGSVSGIQVTLGCPPVTISNGDDEVP